MAYKMPELLAARVKKYKIPESALQSHAMFDWVYIWQLPDYDGERAHKDSGIILTQKAQGRRGTEAPRGVIVSAGLSALDQLVTNGAGIGSIVDIVRLSPWRKPVGYVDHKEVYLLVTRASGCVGSEDFETLLRGDNAEISFDPEVGHRLVVDGVTFKARAEPEEEQDY